MSSISQLTALEILDSRGRPTIAVTCELTNGATATASVPSGASTGRAEAVELRDGEPGRYRGLGCRRAVLNVHEVILPALRNRTFANQTALDHFLIDLDGTPNKSRLGANAILAVSLAFARSQATSCGVPFYQHLSAILENSPLEGTESSSNQISRLPQLTVNLFSGGKHAGGQVEIQDVLVVPVAATTIDEGLEMVFAVYQAAADLTREKYGTRPLKADEGGLAPPFPNSHAMVSDAVAAIRRAGFQPGKDVSLAIDVASSHFYQDGRYHLDDAALTSEEMIDRLDRWCNEFPILSIEDGLAEEDWEHWPLLRERLTGRAITLGDDFLCTNPTRIQRAIDAGAANALLLKVNQIGTLSEALAAYRLAKYAGWHVTVSARSGETEDNWLADLAVGWKADQIKVGSITQSERLAKYNRLLQIESEQRRELLHHVERSETSS